MKALQKNTKQSKQIKNWLKENKKAIAEFNKRVSKNGLFSDMFKTLSLSSLTG